MKRWLRILEVAAWCVCLPCASALLWVRVEAASTRHATSALLAQGSRAKSMDSSATWELSRWNPTSKRRAINNLDQVLGRLDIPALRLSTPIVEDSNDSSLMVGAGHVRGTAMPGGLGNFVIAAHRDTYFRPLAGIHAGVKMDVVTPEGTFTYVVDSTKIVMPDDVDVLDMGNVPQMTLITCYPFHYIGSAPKRFVVRGHLVSF